MFVCLLDELILVFCYSDLTLDTDGFELASTIPFVLQVNQPTKPTKNILLNKKENHNRVHSFSRVSSSKPEKENDPQSLLKYIRIKNGNRPVIAHLNIYSLRCKFEQLSAMVSGSIDIFINI